MVNKRGWIKVMEVVVAVTIFSVVLLVIYSQQAETVDSKEAINILQKRILNEISFGDNLRELIMVNDEINLKEYFRDEIPINYDYEFRICDMSKDVSPCKMYDYSEIYDKEIYVENIIIAGNMTEYNPKFVNLFMWEL